MTKKKQRLPAYRRAENPPPIQLTERDVEILLTIHAYDGMLSVDQVHRWFFPGVGNKRNAQRRLSLMYHNGFIQRPKQSERHLVPEPIVWLDTEGAKTVAAKLGMEYRDADFWWRKTPRWSQVEHDVLLNEFRYMLITAVKSHSGFSLREWRGQSELRRLFDAPIAYFDQNGEVQTKLVWPDGFCYLRHSDQRGSLALLIELDNGSESNVRFAREKVSPNLHLMLSEPYQQELRAKTGRVLAVLTGSQTRYANIRQEVTLAGGAAMFLFTQFERVTIENVLSGNIWQLSHIEDYFSLETYRRREFQQHLIETARHVPQPKFLQSPLSL